MSEFRRVLLSKRAIFTAVFSVLLCCLFFSFEIKNENITLHGAELSEYISGYGDFISETEKNAENSAMLSAISGKEKYIINNAEKTVSDYSALSGTTLPEADNTVIAAFSGFVMADAAVLAAVAVLLICFSEERSKGLSNIVRCTKNGRAKLALERSAIIFTAALAVSIAAEFFCILTGVILRGNVDIFAPVQSVPEFRFCAMKINIFEYLVLNAAIKALGASVLGFSAQLFLTKSGGIAAAGFAVIIGVAELLLYEAIGGADILAGFKIANVIPLIRGDFFFKNYYNVNFFGKAIGFLPFSAAVISIIAPALIAFGAVISERSRDGEFSLPIILKAKEKLSRFSPNPTLFLWELKKLLINRKGAVIIAAAVWFAAEPVIKYGYSVPENQIRDSYYRTYAGEITEEKLGAMRSELERLHGRLIELHEEYNSLSGSENTVFIFKRMSEFQDRFDALSVITFQAEKAHKITCSRGIKTELVKPDTYDLLLRKDKPTTDKNSMLILLCIIGVFSGIYAYETECGMTSVQRSLKKGRVSLFVRKFGTVLLLSPLVSAGVFAAQFALIGIRSGYNNIGANVQSIELLQNVPFEISLRNYLALICFIRIFSAFALGCIVMFISSRCRTRILSLALSAAILAVPALFSLSGIWEMKSVTDLIGFCMI